MATPDQTRASRLEQALRAADAAGDVEAAQALARELQSLRAQTGGQEQPRGALQPQPTRAPGPASTAGSAPSAQQAGPALSAPEPQPEDVVPALQQIDEADEVEFADYAKSAGSGFLREGANLLTGIERRFRDDQAGILDFLRRNAEREGAPQSAKDQYAEALEQFEAGEQIPAGASFYGTFIRPFFNAGDTGRRILDMNEELLRSRSQAAQDLPGEFLPEGAEGEFTDPRTWINPEAKWHEPEKWFDGTAMPWENPEAFAMAMAQNVASIAPGIIAARVGGGAGATARARALRNDGVLNPTTVRAEAARAGAKVGAATGSGVEYVQIRDATAQQIEEGLRAKWEEEELWEANPEYAELVDAGATEETAKQILTDRYAKFGGEVAGIAGAVLGAPVNKMFAKLGLENATGRASGFAKGATGEAFQESLQSTMEQLSTNVAESQIDPNVPIDRGLAEAFVAGGALGAGIGGTLGAVTAGGSVDDAFTQETRALQRAGFDDWRRLSNERSKLQHEFADPEYANTPAAKKIRDHKKLEELQYNEAQQFLAVEPKIRELQKQFGATPQQIRRTDRLSKRYTDMAQNIEMNRAARASAEEQQAARQEEAAEREATERMVGEESARVRGARQTLMDLETIASGEVIDQDAMGRYEALAEEGLGRFTNRERTRFVLTPEGKRARERLPRQIEAMEQKIASGYRGPERRQDASRRQRVDEMTPEEMRKELFTNPLTGIRNRRALDEDQDDSPPGAYASVDGDSLKWVNDNMGHTAGDEMLKKIAAALDREPGVQAYHTGGDEFVVTGDSQEQVQTALERSVRRLSKYKPVESEMGAFQPQITFGIGDTFNEADAQLNEWKARRQAEGKRAPREGVPPTFTPSDTAGEAEGGQLSLPIMSLEETESKVSRLTQEIESLSARDDEFSVRRVAKLNRDLIAAREQAFEEGEADLARLADAMHVKLITPRSVKLDWLRMSQDRQRAYELKSNEFWTPYVGEYVSPFDVFAHEQGLDTLLDRLPSPTQNMFGAPVQRYEDSAEHAMLTLLMERGTIAPEVSEDIRKVGQTMRETLSAPESITSPQRLMSLRIEQYVGGLHAMGGPTPFSPDVARFKEMADKYRARPLPLLSAAVDPISGYAFHRNLSKGDRVEAIIDGQSVNAMVASDDGKTVVLRWEEGPEVFDPDVKAMAQSARFDKLGGHQVSARMARGGNPYREQTGSWPGQARLGRRWNNARGAWETSEEVVVNAHARATEPPTPAFTKLKAAARQRASAREMHAAKRIVERVFRGATNLPEINIVSSVAGLPVHLQQQLVSHGSSGTNVKGMFDPENPEQGIYLIAGNIAQSARRNEQSFDEAVAETVLHETVGHYGLRGMLGSDRRLAQYMDAVARSFPEEVQAKAMAYGLAIRNTESGKVQYLSEDARRLAAEEYIAELAQKQLLDPESLIPEQKSVLRKILDFIRGWLIRHDMGRMVRLDDRALAEMLWNASRFVQSGPNWFYRLRTGETTAPQVRDIDIFGSQMVTVVAEAQRPTNGAERKQMKQQGLTPAQEVPLFPEEARVGQYKDAFEKASKDGLISKAEMEWVDPVAFLDTLTYGDIVDTAGVDALSPRVRAEYESLVEIIHFDENSWGLQLADLRKQERRMANLRDASLPFPGLGEDAIAAYEQMEARVQDLANSRPDEEARALAVGKLDELLGRRPGKKERIPKSVIRGYVESVAAKIQVMPSVDYQFNMATDEEKSQMASDAGLTVEQLETQNRIFLNSRLDIRPDTWSRFRSSGGSYSTYVPFGVDRNNYGEYVFASVNPSLRNKRGVVLGGHTFRSDFSEHFAHMRYALQQTPDGPVYEIIEVQSDTFQGTDGAPETAQEAQTRSEVVERNRTILHHLAGVHHGKIMAEVARVHRADSGVLPDRYQMASDLRNAADRARAKVDDMNIKSTDDARFFDQLDQIALAQTYRWLAGEIDRVDLSEGGDPVAEVLQRIQSDGAGFYHHHHRVFAKPDLAKEFLTEAYHSVTGAKPTPSEVDEMMASAVESLKMSEIRVDVFKLANEQLNSTEDVRRAATNSIGLRGLLGPEMVAKARGDLLVFTFPTPTPEDLESRGFSATEDVLSTFSDLFDAAIIAHQKNRWKADEERRIQDVQTQINSLRADDDLDYDEDAARAEISFDGGMDVSGWLPVEPLTKGDWVRRWTDREVDYYRNNARGEWWLDRFGVEGEALRHSDGDLLDTDHTEYQDRVEFDEDGDVEDDSAAEEWLMDAREEAARSMLDEGEMFWNELEDSAEGEWDLQVNIDEDRAGYVFTAELPVEWNERGEAVNWIQYAAVAGQFDGDTNVDKDLNLFREGRERFLNYLDNDADDYDIVEMIVTSHAKYLRENNIVVPENAQSLFRPGGDSVPEDLSAQLEPREMPSFDGTRRALREMPHAIMTSDQQAVNPETLWKNTVMLTKGLNQSVVERTPWNKSWKEVALKFALADAVRKGATKIQIQGSDASPGRGGYGQHQGYAIQSFRFEKQTENIQGREQDVFVIYPRFNDGRNPYPNGIMLDANRMEVVLGRDVSRLVQQRSEEGSNEVALPTPAHGQFSIEPVGDAWWVTDNQTSVLRGRFNTAEEAAEFVRGMQQPAEASDTSGLITAMDVGHTIYLAPADGVDPDSYYDTAPSSSVQGMVAKARGARVAYDTVNVSLLNKLLKPYKSRVKEGVRYYENRSDLESAFSAYGSPLVGDIPEDMPQYEVQPVSGGRAVVIDRRTGELHNHGALVSEEQARDRVAELNREMMLKAATGTRTFEIEITDEMRKALAGGNIPIMMADTEDSPAGTPRRQDPRETPTAPWSVTQKGEGNLYLTRVGPNAGTVSKERKSDNDIAIRVDESVLLPDYLYYVLQYLQPRMQSRMRGTAQQFITVKDVDEILREHFGSPSQGSLPVLARDPIEGDPTLEAAAEKINQPVPSKTLREVASGLVTNWRQELNQGVFDRFYGIRNAMDRSGKTSLPAEDDPYVAARFTTGLDSQMRSVLTYGHAVWRDGIMQTSGKGLLDILAPVSEPAMLRAWSMYMAGTRAKRLMAEGREHLFTPAEIDRMVQLGERYPAFKTVAREYAAFNKGMLDFAEEAGIINPETRPMWEHADYVPFYRIQEESVVGPIRGGGGVANQRNQIKMLQGGDQALGDIPTNIVMNAMNLMDAAMKNHAARMAVDTLDGTGTVAKIPSLRFEQKLVSMASVKKMLRDAGIDVDAIPSDVLKGFQQMTVAEPQSGPGIFSVMRDGKREYYRTEDQLLFDAMTQINKPHFGRWINVFRGPKRFLTTAVTLDPGFMLRNYIRDLVSSFVQSRDTNNPATHALRSVQGFKQALMEDESLRTMMSAGAAFDSGYINQGDPNATSRAIRKEMRKKGFRSTVLDSPAKLFELYKSLGAGLENANRIAVYNEAIANGKSKAQAAFEAKDLMDFSMGGSWPVIQFLIQSVPFTGARLQGLHRLGRGFVDNPMAFTFKGVLIGLAGMALFLRYRDDERYKELEQWDRHTYFHFWIGEDHYRLPKPFEVGAIFNTIPEMMMEFYESEEGDRVQTALDGFGHMLAETFSMNPLPQVVMPAVENMFNHNFFTGRSIVSPYEENRLPPDQFSAYTSPSLIEMARALPPALDKVDPRIRSPKYMANLWSGYTGTLGNYFLQASDAAVRHFMDYPARPTLSPSEYPVLGSFYRGTDKDPGRTKYEQIFYDTLRDAMRVKGSLSYLDKMMAEDRMEFVEDRYEGLVGVTRDLEIARRNVRQLNRDMIQVWMDPDMTPEEKRATVDEIAAAKNEIFEAMYPLRTRNVMNQGEGATEDDLTFMLEEFGVDRIQEKAGEKDPNLGDVVSDVLGLQDESLLSLARQRKGAPGSELER